MPYRNLAEQHGTARPEHSTILEDQGDESHSQARLRSSPREPHLPETPTTVVAASANLTLTVDDDHNPKAEKKDPTVVEAQTDYSNTVAKEDYSVFTTWQKRWIIIAASFASWFSPMTGSIYFPALSKIAEDLHVSDAKVSITVTTYLIIQGLAPMMIAGFSDKAGRRPAYFICFAIYIVANLALGLQDSYVALLVLRMLQSAGSSGTVALANGVVGDLVTSAERGKYVAWASLGVILGPSLSPVIGGLLSQYLDYHWIFWFLLILSVVFYIPFFLFMPETCRKIVGDGSVPPPWSSWNLSDQIRHRKRSRQNIAVDNEKASELRKNYRISIPNPISSLRILTDLEAALLLLSTGLGLACYYAIITGASVAFTSVYGFNQLQVGLVFLSIGGGSILSAFTTGKLIDWNYKRHARRLNFPVTKNRLTDLSAFPIERARLEIGLPCQLLGGACVIGYGFMMSHHVSIAGPVIMLFLFGYLFIAGSQTINVLMVDIYPTRAAAATAANNVVRCLLGAASSAAIVPMTEAMGNGLAYLTLVLLFFVGCLGQVACVRYGMKWREKLKEKAARRERRRADNGSRS